MSASLTETIRRATMVCCSVLSLTVVNGCVEDETDSQLQVLDVRLTAAIEQFSNADVRFGPSSNGDELIKNAYWLDRMVESINEVEVIEAQAIALGAAPLTEIRAEMQTLFRRNYETLISDSQYVDSMAALERAQIWLDVLD